MNAGELFIGYDHCSVFNAVDILRYFNCNGYHHSSRSCKSAEPCPNCAMSNHAVGDCTANQLKCVNCLAAIDKEKLDVNPDYAVDKFKKDLLFKQ